MGSLLLPFQFPYVCCVRYLWNASSCEMGDRGAGVALGISGPLSSITLDPSMVIELLSLLGFASPAATRALCACEY
jgi:hypothetical protein